MTVSWKSVIWLMLFLPSCAASIAKYDERVMGDFSATHYHASVVLPGKIGSALALDEEIVVTNAHVVATLRIGASVPLVRAGKMYSASLLAVSDRLDLALLRQTARFVPPVIRRATPIVAGETVIATGSVRGAGGDVHARALQGEVMDTAFQLPFFGRGLLARVPGVARGYSGGAVLDSEGRFVGMVTAVAAAHTSPFALAATNATQAYSIDAFLLNAKDVQREAARLLALVRTNPAYSPGLAGM